MILKIAKIISGGQTGADRAALDAAIACNVPHGGWCPKGRLAEDGRIPKRYQLQEMDADDYPSRTRANVEAADLTLIFSHGPLTGGSLLTQQFAEELNKPCVHMDLLAQPDVFQCLESGSSGGPLFFQTLEKIKSEFPMVGNITLNIAGPRASGDPQIYDAVYEQLLRLLERDSL